MIFNLNEFLMAVSFALDFVEIDLLGLPSNHGKRVAFISLKIAEYLGLSEEEKYDMVSLGILHDNGVNQRFLNDRLVMDARGVRTLVESKKDHCIIGEKNVRYYPFLTDVKDVIKYHHERYDGEGFFNINGGDIPLMSQILFLADTIEISFAARGLNTKNKHEIESFIKSEENRMFSKKVVDAFLSISNNVNFWVDLKNDFITNAINRDLPVYNTNINLTQIHEITKTFSSIIDSKSKFTQKHSMELSEKAGIMADYYNLDEDEKMKLIIAADLHDIGKLAVPNSILDSPRKLNEREFTTIKEHSYYTRLSLEQISGFEDITEWASNHHEKLNGTGYPFGKTADKLDFNSRLLTCLDIYQALTEERPYRVPLSHHEAMNILEDMADDGLIDCIIVSDIDNVFVHQL